MQLKHFDYRLIINFFGISAFALIAAVLLHELGHILALYITEGKIAHLAFQPFEGAKVIHQSIRHENTAFIASAGILLGSLMGGLITASLWKFRNSFFAPFLMIGVAAFGGNGLMLVLGSLTSSVGDVTKLIFLGIAKGFLFLLGLAFLLIGFILFFVLQRHLGINKSDSFLKRWYILAGGLMPYILCILIYNLVYNRERFEDYFIYVCGSIVLASGAALFAKYLDFLGFCTPSKTLVEIRWPHVIFSFVLGSSAIILCLLFLK